MRDETAPAPGVANDSSRLDNLLVEAAVSTGAHIGVVYLLGDGGEVLMMEAELGLPAPVARAWARIRTNDPVPIAQAVRERRMVWLPDREKMARRFPSAAVTLPYPFALAGAPIMCGDEVCGGFVLCWPSGLMSELSPRQVDIIDTTCAELGDLIGQEARLGHPIVPGPLPRILDPHPDPTELECLNRLPEGYCSLDMEGRVTLLTAAAADLLDVRPSELLGRRLWERSPWLEEAAYEDRYLAAVFSRQTTSCTAGTPSGRRLTFQFHPGLTGVTVRITPSMAARGPGRIAPDTGGERSARMIALHDMLHLASTLSRAVTAQEVIDLVADHVMPVYNIQALAILTSNGGRMRVAASRGYSRQAVEEFDGRPVIPPALAGRSHDAGKPAFFSTWDELRRTYPDAVRSDDMSAWAFLPLITSGGPIGTCILAYDQPHCFTADERVNLTALAGLIAQAFERARLYDIKHQLAQYLQQSLLPQTLPEIPGLDLAARYLPATPGMDIGGDFYDLIRLSDTLAAAVIGDVQGHDVTAAALMGQVRTAIHAHATAGANPGEVLTHTNRLLVELAPDRFTSCLYVSLDLERHTACLASAGHLPPLLCRPGLATQVIDTSPGLLLGIDPEAEYTTSELALSPGSVLTLYTDGLIEHPGLDLGEAIADLAGRFSLCHDWPLHDLAEALIKPVAVEQRTDDVAVLLLRDATDRAW